MIQPQQRGNSAAVRKATTACLFFTGVGIAAWWVVGWTAVPPPLLAYYAALVLNSFFSIRTFAPLTPANAMQYALDAALVLVYFGLAFSMHSATLFSAVSAALFLISIVKYVHLQQLIESTPLLSRKIRLNMLAALLSSVSLGISLAGFPALAAWLLGTIFVLANVYLLAINPMYRIERPH